MEFEKYKFENTETEVNTIALVSKVKRYQDGDGDTHEAIEIVCSFMTIEEAEKHRDLLNKHKHKDISYDSFCVEMKTKTECEHPSDFCIQTGIDTQQCAKCCTDL
jgi:hypothetical protein